MNENNINVKYHNLLKEIISYGNYQEDPNRKGTFRKNITHYSFVHDFKDGFPAISTKKLYFSSVATELLWFLKGDSNIKYLVDNGCNIWNKDCYDYYMKCCARYTSKTRVKSYDTWLKDIKDSQGIKISGDCGLIYGIQWRKWNCTDQISNLIKNLKEKPLATDHIVTAWNPAELEDMALPPCHKGFQIMVYPLASGKNITKIKNEKNIIISETGPKYGFDLVWEQRSVDTFLGLPFNIASYALLAHIIGKIVNMVPRRIIGDLRNVHIYDNAISAVKTQLSRNIHKYKTCELEFSPIALATFDNNCKVIDNHFLNNLTADHFKLKDYKSYPSLSVEMLSRTI